MAIIRAFALFAIVLFARADGITIPGTTQQFNTYVTGTNVSSMPVFGIQQTLGVVQLYSTAENGVNGLWMRALSGQTVVEGASGVSIAADSGVVSIKGNVSAPQSTITAAKFNGDAASVAGHAADIVVFDGQTDGGTCKIGGYITLSLIAGGMAKIPFCK